jgi:hypothetical protein
VYLHYGKVLKTFALVFSAVNIYSLLINNLMSTFMLQTP